MYTHAGNFTSDNTYLQALNLDSRVCVTENLSIWSFVALNDEFAAAIYVCTYIHIYAAHISTPLIRNLFIYRDIARRTYKRGGVWSSRAYMHNNAARSRPGSALAR